MFRASAHRVLSFALLTTGLLVFPAAASAYTVGNGVTQLGPQQTVFDHADPASPYQKCGDPYFFEDSPPRAFRDASNRVQLIISHAGGPQAPQGHTRRMLTTPGGSLAKLPLTIDCRVIHTSHNSSDPKTFDNWEWIVSPYTEDGRTIYTLVHNEFHGWDFYPTQCIKNTFTTSCWYNAITLAKSSDGGNSYSHAPAPTHRIASVPYPYVPNTGPFGYYQPSNIVKANGWYYALFRSEKYVASPLRGTCLMRTQSLADPTSWRAYDGNPSDDTQAGFTVTFMNPYGGTPSIPAQHDCAPISPNTLGAMASDLVYSTYYQRYMLVDTAVGRSVNGTPTTGVFYTLSSDLIHWDAPKLLLKAPVAWLRQCGEEPGIRVPAVIDSSSTDRNFTTVGQTADLYFSQSKFADTQPNCPETLDRDLVRIPIRFQF